MRLKSLELQGYKTFASRTLFEFAGMVTCIVGPNGSGKSNIADSLRWVLGEQSYTLLRGKKTEDMIFSGSEHRPRAGMASATITFDNADGWLPIDFSEVAVTRRAYRDGQNEYLINGQRVRLKDVSELLAQSGLAERTYTVIGQGLVDSALSLKAEERRRLFEEAAGIGLHRARREEALNRLEATRRNLERVQDILAELQPRLKSLERQARRAQEWEQVKADLQVLLREWYGYHWRRAQAELTEAKETSRVQEERLGRARDQGFTLDEELGAVRSRINSLRASLNAWHRQSAGLHTRREALSRDLAVGEERQRALVEGERTAQAEHARLHEDLSLLEARCSEIVGEVQNLERDLAEARSGTAAARQALEARHAERAQAEKEIGAARQALSAQNARHSQLQARLAERKTQSERGQQALEAARQALESAEKELHTAQERAGAAKARRAEAEAAREAAEEAIARHRQRQAEAEKERRTIQESHAALAAELARLQAQLDVLEGAEKSLTGYATGTRLLLQAARSDRLPGVHGTLNSFLEVPAELETAISAALGEWLDAVTLDGDGTSGVPAALDLLEGGGSAGALLPLRSLIPENPIPLPDGQEGVLGIASDLVGSPPELRPAVNLLLGNVLVVRDRQVARRILSTLPSQSRAVTLQGEVFLASGPVLSRRRKDGGDAGLLGRQRQRRELTGRLQEAGARLGEMETRLAIKEQELEQLQSAGERLAGEARKARQAAEAAARTADAAALAAEGAVRQARWQAEQRKRLQDDLHRAEGEAARMATDLAQVTSDLEAARQRVRETNHLLSSLSLDEVQSQVSYWNTAAAVAERALADGKARQREREAALERAQRTRSAVEARLVEIATAITRLEEERERQRQDEAQVAQEIESLRALIDPAEAELDDLEQSATRLQNRQTAARQALSLAEHQYAQARIGLARRQEALDSLHRRIEDDFGLVAFEWADAVPGQTTLPLEGMVEQLPTVHQISPDLEDNIHRQRAQLRRMGAINIEARIEYQEVKERYGFLKEQVSDLHAAEAGVRQVIVELDGIMQREFRKTFNAVAAQFKEIFTRLFGGGAAQLVLTDPDDLNSTGIDIEARLPGRRVQGLSLLSGGERSLTAAALVFALLKVSPTPFCVLDEVDAMLDEANVHRLRSLLLELSQTTQFVIVTHNRNTVQAADVIYGITMGRDSASQIVSLKLDEVSEIVE